MRYFYFVCDFMYVYTKVLLTFWLISRISTPKLEGMAEKLAPIIISLPIAVLNVYNSSISESLFSSGMMLIIVWVISLSGKVIYKEYQGSSFVLSFMFWALLALLDFLLLALSYSVFEFNSVKTDLLIKAGYERGIYLIIMIPVMVLICLFLKKPLENGTIRIVYSGIRGVFLSVLTGGCIIYFQRIYVSIVSERYMRSWGIFIMVSLIAILIAVIFIEKQKEKEKNNLRQLKIDMLEKNYQELVQRYKDKSSLLHDIRNHMNVIKEYAVLGQATQIIEYIERNYSLLYSGDGRIWSNHQLLDLILNMKNYEAVQEHITLDAVCDDMSELNVDEPDLCSLFTNLLDNAIEANMRREEGGERWISLSCRRHGSMLVITVENPVDEESVWKREKLVSTKMDSDNHGLGMYIMQKVLDKYDGYMEYEVQNSKFRIVQYLSGFQERGEWL